MAALKPPACRATLHCGRGKGRRGRNLAAASLETSRAAKVLTSTIWPFVTVHVQVNNRTGLCVNATASITDASSEQSERRQQPHAEPVEGACCARLHMLLTVGLRRAAPAPHLPCPADKLAPCVSQNPWDPATNTQLLKIVQDVDVPFATNPDRIQIESASGSLLGRFNIVPVSGAPWPQYMSGDGALRQWRNELVLTPRRSTAGNQHMPLPIYTHLICRHVYPAAAAHSPAASTAAQATAARPFATSTPIAASPTAVPTLTPPGLDAGAQPGPCHRRQHNVAGQQWAGQQCSAD